MIPDRILIRWVVELFGFDPELPLAKDMEEKGVKAIVMEVRFSQVAAMFDPQSLTRNS